MNQMLAELAAHPWAMEPKALEAFFAKVSALPILQMEFPATTIALPSSTPQSEVFTSDSAADSRERSFFGDDAPRRSRMSVAGGVARIPVYQLGMH